MYDVTAIGEALIDFIPAQRDCALKEVESFTRVCGGAPTLLLLLQNYREMLAC